MTREDGTSHKAQWPIAVGVLLLLAALLYSAWMMSHVLGGEFRRGYLGSNGARYSIMAKNVLRADVKAVNYAPLLNMAEQKDLDPYLHHPPLLHWMLALVFHVFGEEEDHARLLPYLFTLLNLVLIFLLGWRILGGPLAGGLAAVIAAALPMTSYYGAHIDVQGSPVLFFILAGILCYFRWVDTSARRWYALGVVFFVVGTLIDWHPLYLIVLLPLHYWLHRRGVGETLTSTLAKAWPFIVVGLALFLALCIWLSTAGEPKGPTLVKSLHYRLFTDPKALTELGQDWDYFQSKLYDYCLPHTHSLMPWPFYLLIVLGWIIGRWGGIRTADPFRTCSLWLFFLLGTVHILLFPFGLLIHDYWAFLYVPWLAFAGALTLQRIVEYLSTRSRTVSVATTIIVCSGVVYSGHEYSFKRFDMEIDDITYPLALAMRQTAQPGEAVLTNATNYNRPEAGRVDNYTLYKPALAYYADRVIRGDIETPEQFEKIVKRRDDFVHFIFIMPFKTQHQRLYKHLETNYPGVKRVAPGIVGFRLK